jgi:TPP-dependent indolepyruvate ferredoxin oxidoreductase alpha subunit
MARRGIFKGLRRRRSALCLIFAYALLLNALTAAVFNVQAVAAALDPLATAATCDSTGSATGKDPVRHSSQHQPDCTLCSPACPMGSMAPALTGAIVPVVAAPFSLSLDVSATPASSVDPRSIYVSDRYARAPPTIG